MYRIALIPIVFGLIACVTTAPEISRPIVDKNEDSRVALAGEEVNAVQDKGDSLKGVMESDSQTFVEGGKSNGQLKTEFENDEKDLANKGLVSDIINATISGVQFGIGLGTTNGTLDRLCIKIGGITMAGCRRAAPIALGLEAFKDDRETSTPVD